MSKRLFPYYDGFEERESGNVKTGGKVKYSHGKSYDMGWSRNSTPRTRYPDDDEGGAWDESEMAEAGMTYRKPL